MLGVPVRLAFVDVVLMAAREAKSVQDHDTGGKVNRERAERNWVRGGGCGCVGVWVGVGGGVL